MVHANKAYASANANNNPLSQMLAREALRLLGANIETVVAEPGNVEVTIPSVSDVVAMSQPFEHV